MHDQHCGHCYYIDSTNTASRQARLLRSHRTGPVPQTSQRAKHTNNTNNQTEHREQLRRSGLSKRSVFIWCLTWQVVELLHRTNIIFPFHSANLQKKEKQKLRDKIAFFQLSIFFSFSFRFSFTVFYLLRYVQEKKSFCFFFLARVLSVFETQEFQ